MIRIVGGYAVLAIGLLVVLVVMHKLYEFGFLGTLAGFLFFLPVMTLFVFIPTKNMINRARKERQ